MYGILRPVGISQNHIRTIFVGNHNTGMFCLNFYELFNAVKLNQKISVSCVLKSIVKDWLRPINHFSKLKRSLTKHHHLLTTLSTASHTRTPCCITIDAEGQKQVRLTRCPPREVVVEACVRERKLISLDAVDPTENWYNCQLLSDPHPPPFVPGRSPSRLLYNWFSRL